MTNGTQVVATVKAKDSFYSAVMGRVVGVSGGWVKIEATRVQDKWSRDFYDHPTSCLLSVPECDVRAA